MSGRNGEAWSEKYRLAINRSNWKFFALPIINKMDLMVKFGDKKNLVIN